MESKEPIILSDVENNYIISPSFLTLTDFTQDDFQQKALPFYSVGEHERPIIDDIYREADEHSSWNGYISLLTKNGKRLFLKLSVQAFSDIKSQKTYLLKFEVNHSEQTRFPSSQSQQNDAVTGLPNAYLFRDRIDQAILSAPRQGKSLALFIIKIDQLNVFNEAFGIEVGNRLLEIVTERLQVCVRHDDSVARYDDDQFGLVLQITSTDDSVLVAKKILRFLSKEFNLGQQKVTISPRIGISLWPIDGKETSELLALAGTALHQTEKQTGGNYTFYSQEFNTRAKQRVELEDRLRLALKNENFVLYYQPKVRASDHKIVGMEGLIRWIDPERGLISPGEFIPLAEESGLIQAIGLWVLEEGCRQNKKWIEKSLSSHRLSLNVSSRQLNDENFVEDVIGILKKTRLPARYLELEITESLLITDIDKTIDKLHKIREFGCHIAIDDFGTGYSSLSYLTRIPLDTVKIDRSFISNIETETRTAEVTRGIISLSKSLSLEVVAEGAETDAHVAFLRNHQCDSVQGYYYSKPLPTNQFEQLLVAGYIPKDRIEPQKVHSK